MMASMFSELIIAYLFLGGAGGGCCLVTAALTWLAQPAALGQVLAGRLRGAAARPWQRFFGALHLASLGALIVGAVCLMADLGRPDRLLLVLLHPVPTYVGFGAWAVILCIGLTAVNCSVWLGLLPATRRKLLVLSSLMAVAAAAVVLYTGLMLSDIPAIPLWNTPWLVALFVLSALSCGVALALCAAFVSGSVPVFLSTLMRLARVDAAFIATRAAPPKRRTAPRSQPAHRFAACSSGPMLCSSGAASPSWGFSCHSCKMSSSCVRLHQPREPMLCAAVRSA